MRHGSRSIWKINVICCSKSVQMSSGCLSTVQVISGSSGDPRRQHTIPLLCEFLDRPEKMPQVRSEGSASRVPDDRCWKCGEEEGRHGSPRLSCCSQARVWSCQSLRALSHTKAAVLARSITHQTHAWNTHTVSAALCVCICDGTVWLKQTGR